MNCGSLDSLKVSTRCGLRPNARQIRPTVDRDNHKQDGYKAHVVVEPHTGLFTAGRLTRASGADNHEAVVGLDLLAADAADATDGCSKGLEVLGDGAYGTGEARAALAAAGHVAVIKPPPVRPSVKGVEGGFSVDDFTVDEAAGTATCPDGVTRPISASRYVTFGAACRGCSLRARCTTSASGRSLKLREHDALLRQARRDWAGNEKLREVYRQHRPMVERSIAWLIGPKARCRKLRYRGVVAGDQWLHTRMASLNLRRLLTLGLIRHNGAWTLA
jgi:Transposase DDE domain